jgi:hypothetical protein
MRVFLLLLFSTLAAALVPPQPTVIIAVPESINYLFSGIFSMWLTTWPDTLINHLRQPTSPTGQIQIMPSSHVLSVGIHHFDILRQQPGPTWRTLTPQGECTVMHAQRYTQAFTFLRVHSPSHSG